MGLSAFCTDHECRTYCFASSTTCSPSSGFVSIVAMRAILAIRCRERIGGLEMTELAAPPRGAGTEIKRISHWIGGRSVAGESGRSGPVYNPATGQQSGAVDFASVEEVDRAVMAAREAFPGWRATSLSKRSDLLFRMRETFHQHREDFARLLTAEHGKVLSDALGEVARGLEVIEY